MTARRPAFHDGVPMCSHLVCPKYVTVIRGPREERVEVCEELGDHEDPGNSETWVRPTDVCIPAVRDMAKGCGVQTADPTMNNLPIGIYRLYWVDGGSSRAAVGMLYDGTRWFAPSNWTNQLASGVVSTDWSLVARIEKEQDDAQGKAIEELRAQNTKLDTAIVSTHPAEVNEALATAHARCDKLIDDAERRGDQTGADAWLVARNAIEAAEKAMREAREKQTWRSVQGERVSPPAVCNQGTPGCYGRGEMHACVPR